MTMPTTPNATASDTTPSSRLTGIALIATALALVAVSVAEFSAGDARGDGDNAADGLRFLEENGVAFSLSGLALVVGGVALVVSVLAMRGLLSGRRRSLAAEAASTFGVLGGGFLAATGVMRMQSVGTVPYIGSLDEGWGESAYLVVQIAGTQGLLTTGILALSAWLISTAIGWWRRGLRGPTLFAVFPIVIVLILLADLALPFLTFPDDLFVVYIVSITLGLPLCCLALVLSGRAGAKLRTA